MKIDNIIEKEYDHLAEKKITEIKQVPNSKIVSKLLCLYENFLQITPIDSYGKYKQLDIDSIGSDDLNEILRKAFPFHPWTSENITEFCFALTPYQEVEEFNFSGIFISELIHQHFADSNLKKGYDEKMNAGNNAIKKTYPDEKDFKEKNLEKKETYLIPTDHLYKKIDYLGCEGIGETIIIQGDAGRDCCTKMKAGTVTFTGNVGHMLCHEMSGGNVRVEGNVLASAGCAFQGGTLLVKGNAENQFGEKLIGGTLRIEGNVMGKVGNGMRGGEIYLNGAYESIGPDIFGGKIYHKEKVIMTKWKNRWNNLLRRK